jgi:hypothetical protein
MNPDTAEGRSYQDLKLESAEWSQLSEKNNCPWFVDKRSVVLLIFRVKQNSLHVFVAEQRNPF